MYIRCQKPKPKDVEQSIGSLFFVEYTRYPQLENLNQIRIELQNYSDAESKFKKHRARKLVREFAKKWTLDIPSTVEYSVLHNLFYLTGS